MASLKDLPIGQVARVLRVTGEGAVRRRIMDMGITRGCEVYVEKLAPLGDPIVIILRGYSLTLRREDAARVELFPASEEDLQEVRA